MELPAGRDRLRSLLLGAGLGLIGLSLNLVALPLLGADLPAFSFGGAAVLLAFARGGATPGVFAALVAFGAGFAAGPAGALFAAGRVLEASLAARLHRRSGSWVLSVALYWSSLGWVLYLVGFAGWLGLGRAAAPLFVCQVLNGVLNALIAEAALGAAAWLAHSDAAPEARPLRVVATALLTGPVVVPLLLLAGVSVRILHGRQVERARDERNGTATALAADWGRLASGGGYGAEAIGAELARARLEPSQTWTVVDASGRVVARKPAAEPGSRGLSPATLRALGLDQAIVITQPAGPPGWTLRLEEPLAAQPAAAVGLLPTVGVFLAALLLPYARAIRLTRRLSDSLESVDRAVSDIQAGEFSGAGLLRGLSLSPIAEVRTLASHASGVLDALTHYDPLTGLPNRKGLLEHLNPFCAQALERGENFALLLVDLDRFGAVDRSLGRSLGNEVLRRIAGRLKDCVGTDATVARVGGDEFTLLIPRMGRMEDATETARKIMDAIKRPLIVEAREVFVTASVGIGLFPRDGEDAETLLKNATAATDVAKERGQGSIRRYTARITAREAQRLSIESGLRRALEQGGLLVHYQPIVEIKTGRIEGAEALARWNRPDAGLVVAADFISVAEASGLVASIDIWVLRRACTEAARWNAAGHAVRVAANISARHLQEADFADQVAHYLHETGLPAGMLEIEITEQAAMQDVERSVETLTRVRALGVSVSVDDFGTGYSSLSYLKRLPVDRVKLDQSFVSDLITSADDAAIASAVIAMSHSLNLEVIAEGVETEEQLAFLGEHGCDAIQGYLLSRPVPVEALERLLEQGQLLPARRTG